MRERLYHQSYQSESWDLKSLVESGDPRTPKQSHSPLFFLECPMILRIVNFNNYSLESIRKLFLSLPSLSHWCYSAGVLTEASSFKKKASPFLSKARQAWPIAGEKTYRLEKKASASNICDLMLLMYLRFRLICLICFDILLCRYTYYIVLYIKLYHILCCFKSIPLFILYSLYSFFGCVLNYHIISIDLSGSISTLQGHRGGSETAEGWCPRRRRWRPRRDAAYEARPAGRFWGIQTLVVSGSYQMGLYHISPYEWPY